MHSYRYAEKMLKKASGTVQCVLVILLVWLAGVVPVPAGKEAGDGDNTQRPRPLCHAHPSRPEQRRELSSNECQEQGQPQTARHQVEQGGLGGLEDVHDSDGGAQAQDVGHKPRDEVRPGAARVVTEGGEGEVLASGA